jgi:hypothetical protein
LPTDYEIKFDKKNLEISKQEMLHVFGGCFDTYKKQGFKKVKADAGK